MRICLSNIEEFREEFLDLERVYLMVAHEKLNKHYRENRKKLKNIDASDNIQDVSEIKE